MATGIDVSNNNGHVDWLAIAQSGVRFAYCKATQGTTFVDSFYEQNRAGAEAHGIHFGAYHFFDHNSDPAAQAKFFVDHARPKHTELLPVLDYEQLPADRAPAEAFVVALQRELGHRPMFYSYLSFIEAMKIPAASPLAQCPLWLADYTTIRPAPPAPWHEIVVWQHSSSGRVPGVAGPVDLDAGTPPTEGTRKTIISHYLIHHLDRHGNHRVVKTNTPGLWQIRHPRAKRNGHLGQDPVHKTIIV